MKSERILKYTFLIVPLLFLLFSAPSALDHLFFHDDERRYNDAVIFMMEKNDFLTPLQWDGETPRFKKPIITYWVLIAGYKIFGISPFSSRFFFWLAGAMLVVISYFMASSLLRNRKTAFLTAFIVASNPLVLMSAGRTIPDILLVLFLTISAWGFLEIMVRARPAKKFYWMAYLGAALAFETKGIPAAVFAGISILFLLFNPWKRVSLAKLLEPYSVIVSLLVALSWFVFMFVLHGSGFLDAFFADQVGERIASRITQTIGNGGLSVLNLVLFSIPWIFIFFRRTEVLKQSFVGINTQTKSIIGFIAVWIVIIIIMSAAVFKFYDRYILPGIPLLSMFFAYFIGRTNLHLRRFFTPVFVVLNVLIWIISVWYLVFISFHIVLFFAVLVESGLILSFYTGGFKKTSNEIVLASAIMLIFFSGHALLYPLITPVTAKQLSTSLTNKLNNTNDTVYMYGRLSMPAKVRVQSHGEMNIVSMDTIFALPNDADGIICFKEKEAHKLKLDGYEIFIGSETMPGIPVERLPNFMQKYVTDAKESGEKYLIGIPK